MWSEDESVKSVAREIVRIIADHHGGEAEIYHIVKKKCPTPGRLHYELAQKINEEMRVLPQDALNLWLTITRLVKERMIDIAQDRMKYWLKIPQVSLVEVLT
jgi:hypothetical protein